MKRVDGASDRTSGMAAFLFRITSAIFVNTIGNVDASLKGIFLLFAPGYFS